ARWPIRLAIVAIVLGGACMIAPVELAHREMVADAAAGTEPSATRPVIPDTAPAGEIGATNAEQKVIAAFREAVAPKYVAYVTAIDQATRAAREHEIKHPRTTTTGWRDDPKVKEAGMALIRAVEANWPFPQPLAGTDVNALREQMAKSPERPFRIRTIEAKAAFNDASDFRSQYHEGKATRDEAVARFVAVADKYPESYEHDQALINAWGLCTQGLVNDAQADPVTAASLMRRLAGRPGSPSAAVLMAELEVSGLNPEPAARLKARIEFYERSVARLNAEWLTANMVLPSADRSCSEYTARLQAVALHLPDMRYFAATGMASDAFVTSDSLDNLSLLAHRYEDDPLVLAAVEQRKQQMSGQQEGRSGGLPYEARPTANQTAPGLLQFRIVPNRLGSSKLPVLGPDNYVEDLAKNGPLAGRQRGDEFQWFEYAGDNTDIKQVAVAGTYEGRQYILLCGRDTLSSASPHPAVMLPEVDGKRLWGIRSVAAAQDNMGRPALSFEFDDAGAEHMERLTAANIGNSLAFLVNGKVISTARIMSTIRDKGQITGRFTAAEVDHLAAMLRTEMMPSSQPGGDGDAKDSIASQPAGGSLEGGSDGLPDRARRVRPQRQ
ncbi:MAG: hypothetical protein GX616_15140, partial [Planctomycetes bacterium]|nr:hypothetical protein [Planctomycetota bacterium]